MLTRDRLMAMLAASMAIASPAVARADMATDVKALNDGWAHIAYEVKGASTQTKALDQLARQAASVVARYPGKAEPLLWQGIVTSEQANRANLFHKLSLATRARDLIARAYAIDPKAAHGGAAMSLGVLYYKVPGSPLAWGDDDKAGKLLKQGLALDPDGLDANYFYADYLIDRGNAAAAKSYLEKALQAPRDAARPVWDAGRRREVRALMTKAG